MCEKDISHDFGVFKKPELPKTGLLKEHGDKSQIDNLKKTEEIKKETTVPSDPVELSKNTSDTEKVRSISKSDSASKSGTMLLPIPYNEPSWGGLPDVLYNLEEMKSGVSLRTISLDTRSFYCFGRFENCHIVMAHPTISRYHAIIQFRSTFSQTDEKRGFYIFDLGSTHGTYVNKARIQPKNFIKLQVGHIIQFGSSTRMFLLHGPEEDQQEESQYSYTQLREMRQKKLEEREKSYLEEQAKMCKEEEAGIDWGMGDDAEEENDLAENPFAVTTNEEIYIDDPKKTLRGWFEREGQELVYDVDEKGYGQYTCKIELPIENANGGYVMAEATVSGKKKEAVFQCALEACRILDRAGVLRQSTHESKQRKRKNWEEGDYYDSDEDNFFDRTGDLDKKRKKRMLQSSKQHSEIDTYESLIEKRDKILQEIKEIEDKLKNLVGMKNIVDDTSNNDTLDSFMSHLQTQQPVDKIELRKYKAQLVSLKKEEVRLGKLVNFTKPCTLPQINVRNWKKEEDNIQLEKQQLENESNTTTDILRNKVVSNSNEIFKSAEPSDTLGNGKSDDLSKSEDKISACKEVKPEQKLAMTKVKSANQCTRKPSLSNGSYNIEYFNNIEWKPPSGQTGDGRTSLNDKYGY